MRWVPAWPRRSTTPACWTYQHCCLRFVCNQITNNESIRERFKIEKQNAAQASRPLRKALEAGRIKAVDPGVGTKLMRYVPYWA